MTISEMINALSRDLSAKDVRDSIVETFVGDGRKYSAFERGVLGAFNGTRFHVEANPDGKGGFTNAYYLVRPLKSDAKNGGLDKDLYILLNSGMFASDEKLELSDAEKDAVKECQEFSANILDDINACVKPITKKGSLKSSYQIVEGSVLDGAIVEKDRQNFEDKRGVSYAAGIIASKELIAGLSTFLAIVDRSVLKDADPKTVDFALRYIANDICQKINGIDKIDAGVGLVNRVACTLTNARLGRDDIAKHFYRTEMLSRAEEKINEFNDLPISLDNVTSNYAVLAIHKNGACKYRVNVQTSENEEEAKNSLKSGEAPLSAIKFFDKKMMENEENKKIDNFEDAAMICLANLVLVEQMPECELKGLLQQMFSFPLCQCLDHEEVQLNISNILDRVKEKVEALPLGITVDIKEPENALEGDLIGETGMEPVSELDAGIVSDSEPEIESVEEVEEENEVKAEADSEPFFIEESGELKIDDDDMLEPDHTDVELEPISEIDMTPLEELAVKKIVKVNLDKEASKFRKKVIDTIKKINEKKGLLKAERLLRMCDQRSASKDISHTLSMDGCLLNKTEDGVSPKRVDDVAMLMPPEDKNLEVAPMILSDIYQAINIRIGRLSSELDNRDVSKEELNEVIEKVGLSKEGAYKLVEEVYSNYFDDNGDLLPRHTEVDPGDLLI